MSNVKVKLKNGRIGTIVGDVHIVFDNYDSYSYTVPSEDIVSVVDKNNEILIKIPLQN